MRNSNPSEIIEYNDGYLISGSNLTYGFGNQVPPYLLNINRNGQINWIKSYQVHQDSTLQFDLNDIVFLDQDHILVALRSSGVDVGPIPTDFDRYAIVGIDLTTGAVDSIHTYQDGMYNDLHFIDYVGDYFHATGYSGERPDLSQGNAVSIRKFVGKDLSVFEACPNPADSIQITVEDVTWTELDSLPFPFEVTVEPLEVWFEESPIIIEDVEPTVHMICPESGPINLSPYGLTLLDCSAADSATVQFRICNEGFAVAEAGISASLYDKNPLLFADALRLATVSTTDSIGPTICRKAEVQVATATLSDSLFLVINDAGGLAPPFALSELVTGSSYEDVVVEDNLSAIAFEADISVRDSITNVSALGAADGRIAVEVDYYFTNPYSFLWSTGDTTQVIEGLSVGEYTLTVTNAQGCRKLLMYEVETTVGTVEVVESVQFDVFPNPISRKQPLRLVLRADTKAPPQRVLVYDVAGKVYAQAKWTPGAAHLELPSIEQSGMYFVQLIAPDGRAAVRKVVVY